MRKSSRIGLPQALVSKLLVFSFDGRYTKDAIYKKIERLGLEVVDEEVHNQSTTTSKLELPEELPSVEETLIKLSVALSVLEKPGLEKTDILRLSNMILGVKVYKELLADYMDYRGLEAELVELRKKYAELPKTQGVPTK